MLRLLSYSIGLLILGCATTAKRAPRPEAEVPVTQREAGTVAAPHLPLAKHEKLRVEPAQVAIPVGPLVLPKPIVVPAPAPMVLPRPMPLVVMPDELREQMEREELGGLPPETTAPDTKPKEQSPQQDAPRPPPPSAPKERPLIATEPPEQVEAGRKRATNEPREKPARATSQPPKVYKDEGEPAPDWVPDDWVYPPGKRPCHLKGTGGSGLSKPGGSREVRCTYDCGGREVKKTIPGTSRDVCLAPSNRPVY